MQVGDVTVDRVVEWVGPVQPIRTLLPDVPDRIWREQSESLAPLHHDPDTGYWRAAMQTWVVRLPGLLVLVDTGVGNGRDRPQAPSLSDLDTAYLERLEKLGVEAADVDVVINTHIHYDHVGWNTRSTAAGWRPTFPNARYVIPAADYEYFHPDNAAARRPPRTEDEQIRFEGMRLVFDDSIRPIAEAGQMQTWAGSLQLHPRMRLEQAPGHTPGSSVVRLDDGAGGGALFVGDLLHSPVQLLRPDDACAFDLDAEAAAGSRRRVLAQAAEEDRWILPAHIAGAGGFRVRREGDEFRLHRWADLEAV